MQTEDGMNDSPGLTPNPEHLTLLKSGVDKFNQWRTKLRKQQQRLEVELMGAQLQGFDIKGIDLSDANLRAANLLGSNLEKANLSGSCLVGANLRNANLKAANLYIAELISTDFYNANLSYANLKEAELRNANLAEASLTSANCFYAIMYQANLNGADLTGTEFIHTKLAEAIFCHNAFSSDTNFSEAIFSETVICDCDLSNVQGLNAVRFDFPCSIDIQTLQRSGKLPLSFLRGCGLTDSFIDYLPSLFCQPIQFYHCFISYSRKDEIFVDRLYADLQNKGIRCWLDKHDLPWGARTHKYIEEEIKRRDKVILVLSKNSIISDWVEDEVEHALSEEDRRSNDLLVPFRIDDDVMECKAPWAKHLKRKRNFGLFRDWTDPIKYNEDLEKLIKHLRRPV